MVVFLLEGDGVVCKNLIEFAVEFFSGRESCTTEKRLTQRTIQVNLSFLTERPAL